MQYDDAVRTWAAEQFNIPVHSIERVAFGYEEGDGCPTCGYEGYPEAIIYEVGGRVLRENLRYEFGELVSALVEVASRR